MPVQRHGSPAVNQLDRAGSFAAAMFVGLDGRAGGDS